MPHAKRHGLDLDQILRGRTADDRDCKAVRFLDITIKHAARHA
jgi:hypothetical protein